MNRESLQPIRLGINIDHVATLRQARGTPYPDPVEAALLAAASGADNVTLHLREDRRHIQDGDVERLLPRCPVPINLEMAVTGEMIDIACRLRPHFVCLVPERRAERTTEGGLDLDSRRGEIADACATLAAAGIKVSLFVNPDIDSLPSLRACGAPNVEIHTGRYANALTAAHEADELDRIAGFARQAHAAGIGVHAGHGLNLENVGLIASIPEIVELNIGHAIITRSVFLGLPAAVAEMRRAMVEARYGLSAGG